LEATFDKDASTLKVNIIKAVAPAPAPPAVKTRKKKEENNH
jgi:hypothetical protein